MGNRNTTLTQQKTTRANKKHLQLDDKISQIMSRYVNSKLKVLEAQNKLCDTQNMPLTTNYVLMSFMEDESLNFNYYIDKLHTFLTKHHSLTMSLQKLTDKFSTFQAKNNGRLEEELFQNKYIVKGPIFKIYHTNTHHHDNTYFDMFQTQIGFWIPYKLGNQIQDNQNHHEKKLNCIAEKNFNKHKDLKNQKDLENQKESNKTDFLDEDIDTKNNENKITQLSPFITILSNQKYNDFNIENNYIFALWKFTVEELNISYTFSKFKMEFYQSVDLVSPKIIGFKIRGIVDNYDRALELSKKIYKQDAIYDIYVHPMNHWFGFKNKSCKIDRS